MPKNVLSTSTGWCGWTEEHDASCATAVFNIKTHFGLKKMVHSTTVRILHNDNIINQEQEEN